MPQIGVQAIPFRDPAGPWLGMNLDSKAAPGAFELIENGYASSDGDEIRTMPGFVCVIDPSTQQRKTNGDDTTTGYRATHQDARRGVLSASGDYYFDATPTEQLDVYTEPTQFHFMEQVAGRWEIIGESDFVREPIRDSGGDELTISTATSDGSGEITLALSATPVATANTFNAIYATPSGTVIKERVWSSGITGDLADVLNNKGHVVTNVSGNVLTIATVGPLNTASTSQTGRIAKVKPTSAAPIPISDDVTSLTSWTSLALGDPDSVSETVYCAHVANRQRDFGDQTGEIDQGHGQLNGVVDYPRSRRRQKMLPYRLVPHVAGNRIIMAAPGYGCVFQKPSVLPINYDRLTGTLGIDSLTNDIYDKPRSVGLPKAVVWADPENVNVDATATTAIGNGYHIIGAGDDAHSFGGSSHTDRVGTYRFAFAYRDEATGERGLISEPVTVTSTGSGGALIGFAFHVMFPGYLLAESLGLRLDVYRSVKGGNQLFYSETVPIWGTDAGSSIAGRVNISGKYGLKPDTTAASSYYWRHIVVVPTFYADDDLRKNKTYVPIIEQMPMGCKASRTLRGWTMYGGALGDAGSLAQLQSGTMSLIYNRVAGSYNASFYDYQQVGSVNFGAGSGAALGYVGSETPFGVGNSYMPTAYAGESIMSSELFPWPVKQVRLGKVVNTLSGFAGTTWATTTPGFHSSVCFRVENTPLVQSSDISRQGKETYLILPRGRVQISEADNPGIIAGSASTTHVSSEMDQDVEAIGDAGGQAIVATRNRTYIIGFGQSPVGVGAEMVSDRFGCIGANTMVSYDGGCAWISDRGPVSFTGGVSWIGSPLQRLFSAEQARYKTDSTGMMRHAWGCHDPERNLIYFGLFADRYVGTANAVTVNYPARSMATVTISSVGANYVVDDVLTVSNGETGSNGEAATVRVTSVGGGGNITGIVVQRVGKYIDEPGTITLTGGSGTGAAITATWGEGPSMAISWVETALSDDADKIRSRFPCDEILVYSYRTGAWSVWRPPGAIAIQWMTVGKDANGTNRTFFLGNDGRGYVLDDSYSYFVKDPAKVYPSERGSQTTFVVAWTDANRVGVPVLVCHNPIDNEVRIKATRTITAIDENAGTITLDSAVTIANGDWLLIGARSMTLTTTSMSPKNAEASKVNSVVFRASMWSLKSATGSGEDQGAFYRAQSTTTSVLDDEPVLTTNRLTEGDDSSEHYSWSGDSPSTDPMLNLRAAKGTSLGFAHQISVDFIGGAQVRLQNLFTEVQ